MDASLPTCHRSQSVHARVSRRLTVVLSLGFALAWGSAAAASPWVWIDSKGQRVFSDQPPPATVSDRNILKRPGQALPAATPTPPADAAAPAGSKPAPGPATAAPKDDALEKKKKEAEAAEQAKRAAEEKKQKEAMAENCQRAQQAKVNLETAPRLGMTNAQGQTVRMDEATRQAELARVNRIIESSCR